MRLDSEEIECKNKIAKLSTDLMNTTKVKTELALTIKEQAQHNAELLEKLETVEKECNLSKDLLKSFESEKSELIINMEKAKTEIEKNKIEEINQLKEINIQLLKTVQENETGRSI